MTPARKGFIPPPTRARSQAPGREVSPPVLRQIASIKRTPAGEPLFDIEGDTPAGLSFAPRELEQGLSVSHVRIGGGPAQLLSGASAFAGWRFRFAPASPGRPVVADWRRPQRATRLLQSAARRGSPAEPVSPGTVTRRPEHRPPPRLQLFWIRSGSISTPRPGPCGIRTWPFSTTGGFLKIAQLWRWSPIGGSCSNSM